MASQEAPPATETIWIKLHCFTKDHGNFFNYNDLLAEKGEQNENGSYNVLIHAPTKIVKTKIWPMNFTEVPKLVPEEETNPFDDLYDQEDDDKDCIIEQLKNHVEYLQESLYCLEEDNSLLHANLLNSNQERDQLLAKIAELEAHNTELKKRNFALGQPFVPKAALPSAPTASPPAAPAEVEASLPEVEAPIPASAEASHPPRTLPTNSSSGKKNGRKK
jgi:hypothetical protein